ncbi:glycosyltransferase [Aliiroseovarius sp. Z3]|uniref:glycosyltransferase n=1 Tax=Aliiroseovarius sp. Z3 TaxID=2811402 RepID=UPI0023B2A1BC|nr:glycosyltransferase [Aliiroseovarius sp. Z3]MDE9450237.1 glycosyltransferase [Aliiroseovarius sp. Z3]
MTSRTTNTATVTAFPGTAGTTQRTAIVVPCYNEADRLDQGAFLAHLDASPTTDFIFVNDGSRDTTVDRLTALRDAAPTRVTVVDLAKNSGKAEAVRQGLLTAAEKGAALIGYWDADLATPLDAIDDFARVLNKFAETQVVYGARRMMLGHRIERTLGRRIVSRICATLARQAVGLPIGDTQCGAKMMRNTRILRAAVASPFTAGWLFDVEFFARLSAGMTERRFAFYEQPLAEWTEVAGSKVSSTAIVKSGFRMLRLIAEQRLGLSFGTEAGVSATATILAAPSAAILPAKAA